jgi:hypothetical protein
MPAHVGRLKRTDDANVAMAVNGSLPRACVYLKLVNRGAPELFPPTIWLAFGLLGTKLRSGGSLTRQRKTSIRH